MNKSDITRDYGMLKGPLAQPEPVIVWNDPQRAQSRKVALLLHDECGLLGEREGAAPPLFPLESGVHPHGRALKLKGWELHLHGGPHDRPCLCHAGGGRRLPGVDE